MCPFQISSAYRIRFVSPLGVISTIAGTTGIDFLAGDGGPASFASFYSPLLSSSIKDSLWISDRDNYVVSGSELIVDI